MNTRTKKAREIGQQNYYTFEDQADVADGPWIETMAAYLVNTVDTAREERVPAEAAVTAFLELSTRAKVTIELRPPLIAADWPGAENSWARS